jgi:hypothetical protein
MVAPAANFGERVALGGMAAIFERMSLVVTSNTDMQRLAEAVGTPALPLQAGRTSKTYLAQADLLLTRNIAVS